MRVAFLLCLVLLQVQASAIFDVYLKVTPATGPVIAGGSVDPIYSGWIEVDGFESGALNPTTISSATGGAGTGKAKFQDFTLLKKVDPATVLFFDRLNIGSQLLTVKMVIVQRSANRIELWDFKANTGFLTNQSFTANSGGSVDERITFVVGKIEVSYIQLSPSGDALSEYFANWSIITNTGASGTRTPDYLGGLDSDGDGIPDGWEAFYGLNKDIANSDLDTDGDGLNNLEEYIAHTNPRVPQSVLRVTAFQRGTPGNYVLTWQSAKGLNYRIFTAPTPGGPFTFLKNVASAGDGTTSTTVAGPASPFFYRVVTP